MMEDVLYEYIKDIDCVRYIIQLRKEADEYIVNKGKYDKVSNEIFRINHFIKNELPKSFLYYPPALREISTSSLFFFVIKNK